MIRAFGCGAAACGALALALLGGCSTAPAVPARTTAQAISTTPVADASAVTEPVTGTRMRLRSSDRLVKQINAANAQQQMTRDQPSMPMDGGR